MFAYFGKLFSSVLLMVSSFLGGLGMVSQHAPPIATSTHDTAVTEPSTTTGEKVSTPPKATTPTKAPIANTTKSLSPQISSSSPATTPTNTTLCNGTYYTACPSGRELVCPQAGAAFCQQTSQSPTTENTSIIKWPVSASVNYTNAQNYKGMGTYRLFVNVTNHEGGPEIYIPKTTSGDNKGQIIGFQYQIDGDRFFGNQLSSVDCPSWVTGNNAGSNTDYCVVKDGETVQLKIGVYLNPSVQGNYSIKFTKINWTDNYKNGGLGSVGINAETDTLNVSGT